MKNSDFLKEMHTYVDDRYCEFQKMQDEIQTIFNAFHQVCKDKGYQYFVAYGSLLGEVRDGGCIPWDYDMDVCMPIEDAKEFIKNFKNDFGEEYYLNCNYTNDDFAFFEARIGKKDCPLEFVHLDIFYCMYAPNDMHLKKVRARISKLFIRRMHKQYLRHPSIEEDHRMELVRKVYYYFDGLFDNIKSIDRKIERIILKYQEKAHDKIMPINFLNTINDTDDVFPLKLVQINGKEMYFPNKPIEVLNSYYKNYQQYLPIDYRFKEFFDWSLSYSKYQGIENEGYRK